jgi:hypothetical protein
MVAVKEEWTEIWGCYDISKALNVLSVENMIREVIPLVRGDTITHKNEPGVLVKFVPRRELAVDTMQTAAKGGFRKKIEDESKE